MVIGGGVALIFKKPTKRKAGRRPEGGRLYQLTPAIVSNVSAVERPPEPDEGEEPH